MGITNRDFVKALLQFMNDNNWKRAMFVRVTTL